ncbi:hypothetical protein [Microbispora sp. CA-102843]|uniref:hypothetical protein n=1 Tax=Microbispora sp. CA-102843 TaxID=3239952 RepID=UPI003D8C85A7
MRRGIVLEVRKGVVLEVRRGIVPAGVAVVSGRARDGGGASGRRAEPPGASPGRRPALLARRPRNW